MNGLEAIELMKQGKMVKTDTYGDGIVINKIDDGVVYYAYKHTKDSNDWLVDDCFDFTKTYEEYNEPKPLTGWERVDGGDAYIVTTTTGSLMECRECGCKLDEEIYKRANYFSTKEKADEINFKQTLFRKLQRFSDENGGNEIDWTNENERKYNIFYDYGDGTLEVKSNYSLRYPGQVYFSTEDVARKAIELFHDDLIKYFTM